MNGILSRNLLFATLNTKTLGTRIYAPRHELYFNDYIDIDSVSCSMRRAKIDPQRTKPVSSNINKATNLSHDIRNKPESISSSRIDSGRSNARVNRASSMVGLYFFSHLLCDNYNIVIKHYNYINVTFKKNFL